MIPLDPPSMPDASDGPPTRCGYVALIGAPNVGKSTLMNAMVGEMLSIVTPHAQTTWTRVTGIRTEGRTQMVFLDTPGVLSPASVIHRSFLAGAEEAAREADVLALIADPVRPLDASGRARIQEIAGAAKAPRIGVVNKIDAATPAQVESERSWLRSMGCSIVLELSATEETGVDALLEQVEEMLPEGPFLFPADEIASAPVRFFVAEMVRESIFALYREEIPYASICRVEEFRSAEDRTYIQVTIYVERSSQKGILIGERGQAIRALGIRARERVEAFLQAPVYLDLWVKVLPNWRRNPQELRRFGLPIPDEEEGAGARS